MSESNQTNDANVSSFGAWIKAERLKKNINLEEIAAVTKVHISQLKHLEDDQRDKLPAPAFVRGFLISYARHLGLDEDEVLSRYKGPGTGGDLVNKSLRAAQSSSQPKVRLVENSTITQAPATKDLEKPTPPLLRKRSLAIIGGTLAVLIGLTLLISIGKKSRKDEPVKEETATETKTETSTPAATTAAATEKPKETPVETPAPTKAAAVAAAAPANTAPSTPKKYALELRATEQSWVNIRIDDQDSQGMVLSPGNIRSFDADRKVTLSLSDAGSVEIRWNGTWYAPPGFRGDVRSITLPDQLAKLSLRAAVPAAKKKAAAPNAAAPAAGAAPAAPAATPAPAAPAPDVAD